ncbi:MAG: hypothetical protein U9O96_00660 [Candidatus Thermoplasmatota archaeon]|nr:hypothetical protein [Candidatus Thermoplasmatota archaeon]
MKYGKYMVAFVVFLLTSSFTGLLATDAIQNGDNNPPNPPEITGPTSGIIKETYKYNITLTDPDPDDLMFDLEIDFGDGIEYVDCGCGKSWRNGTVVEVYHSWKKVGNYGITARIRDASGEWSEWSESLAVSMPKTFQNPFRTLLGRNILPGIFGIAFNRARSHILQ